MNTTNEEFFNSFEKKRDIPDIEIKLAIGMDMIGLMVDLTDEAGHISFAGHVNDFVKLFDAVPNLSDVAFEGWVEAIYQENNKFKLGGDYPDKFRLIHGDVVCFERLIC